MTQKHPQDEQCENVETETFENIFIKILVLFVIETKLRGPILVIEIDRGCQKMATEIRPGVNNL